MKINENNMKKVVVNDVGIIMIINKPSYLHESIRYFLSSMDK